MTNQTNIEGVIDAKTANLQTVEASKDWGQLWLQLYLNAINIASRTGKVSLRISMPQPAVTLEVLEGLKRQGFKCHFVDRLLTISWK